MVILRWSVTLTVTDRKTGHVDAEFTIPDWVFYAVTTTLALAAAWRS